MDTMKDTKMQPAKSVAIEEQRVLLELAAKAAGYKVHGSGKLFWIWKDSNVEWVDWNPLTDDGDALRLAVKLKLRIATECNQEAAYASDTRGLVDTSNTKGFLDPVPWNGDAYAATRRAIVRAAAEIGRNMK